MISAVEPHLGPGRPSYYASPHMPHSPLHLQPQSSVQIPPPSSTQTGLPNFSNSAAMSVAEQFARPHPKTRINGVPTVRNGMSSPRTKYPDQNGPVNLAVMPNNSPSPHSPNLSSPNNSVSPKDDRSLPMDQSVSVKDTANFLDSFNTSRLPYANNAAALANYYNPLNPFYRYPLYSPAHHSMGRSMQRYEPYPTFLPSVPYSPQPPPQQPGLGPIPISQQNGHNTHKSHVERPPLPSLLPPLNATNPLIMQQQQQQQQQQHHKEMYKESCKALSQNNNNNHKDNNNKSHSPNTPQNHHHNNNNNNNNNLGFKVPSGKEGSLKHRILTRPYDKDGKPQRSPPGITNGMPLNRPNHNNNNNITTNNNNNHLNKGFMKGSIIELANGEFKRVEDMRTEDFILSVKNSSKLELKDSTVVKITPTSNQVIVITFSFDKNRSQVDIDAGIEHPFFVYGKGWASCNPDGTYQLYGLKCQRLQVGDICISLKPREMPSRDVHHEPYDMPYINNNCDLPQNLSRPRPANTTTIPATNTISSTRAAPSPLEVNPHPPSMMSSLPYPTNHLLDLQRSKFGIPQIIEPATSSSVTVNGHHHQQQRPLSHDNPTSLQERYANFLASSMNSNHNPDMPIPMVLPHKTLNQLMAEDANEASAKKRRWSAPGNFEDDTEDRRNALLRGKYSH